MNPAPRRQGGPARTEVPAGFASELRDLYTAADPRLNATLLAANGAGWPAASLARAIGVGRRSVVQRAISGLARRHPPAGLAIPPPPQPVPIPEETLAEMRKLTAVARVGRGRPRKDTGAAAASRRLTEIAAELHDKGVSAYRIAKVTGVTWRAIGNRIDTRSGHL